MKTIKPVVKTRKPKSAPKFKRPYTSPINKTVVMMTDSQYQFTDAVLNTKDSDTLINRVMEIYETTRPVAAVIARQNFSKPNIVEYLGDRGYKAIDVLHDAMSDKDAKWSDRIAAANSIADRQFGKAITKQLNLNADVSIEQLLNSLQ